MNNKEIIELIKKVAHGEMAAARVWLQLSAFAGCLGAVLYWNGASVV